MQGQGLISYVGVSTNKQGRSGLGIEGQRAASRRQRPAHTTAELPPSAFLSVERRSSNPAAAESHADHARMAVRSSRRHATGVDSRLDELP
jgi:hypothetical protein